MPQDESYVTKKRKMQASLGESELGTNIPAASEGPEVSQNDEIKEDNQYEIKEDSQSRDERADVKDAREGNDSPEEERFCSEAMEASIQEIRQRMQQFTQQVSGFLDAGKCFLMELQNAFEERIILVHQKQIEKWEQEIQLLRNIDSLNEDMNLRLTNAQALINTVQI